MNLVKALGADEVIDYKTTNLVDYLKKNHAKEFDVFFDPVGSPELYVNSPYYLKENSDYLDLFGGAHLSSVGEILTTVKNLTFFLILPTFLGGTPRKFKPLMLKAHTMVSEHL